jgi:hypothetical protein
MIKRRSRLEERFESMLKDFDVPYEYEVTKIPYTIPESNHTYTVDFTLSNGVLIEVKGYLSDYAERRKYVLLKEQHPELDLRFIFDSLTKLCGGTKQTHEEWAKKYNFKYCSVKDKKQIESWIREANEKIL